MSDQSINYDLLAAALLRAGTMPKLPAFQDGDKIQAGLHSEPKDDNHGNPTVLPVRGTSERDEGPASPVRSWSDEVEEEVSRGKEQVCSLDSSVSDESVTFAGPVVSVSEATKRAVSFGGMADWFPGVTPQGTKGFYADIVRGERAVALRAAVSKLAGCKLPKASHESFALCTFAAGAIPSSFVSGKERLRMLAAVGDAAITFHLTASMWSVGASVEKLQDRRSRVASNANLRSVMTKMHLLKYVAYPPGADPATTGATSTALEAIVGALSLYRDAGTVRAFLHAISLV